jgi:hypothetical protein
MTGVELIAAERQRQIDALHWTARHDDEHSCGEIAAAAVCYAAYAMGEPVYRKVCNSHAGMMAFSFVDPWPWDEVWDKRDIYADKDDDDLEPTDEEREAHKIRCLAKAGALVAAEIDRLQRKESRHDE